MRSLRQNWNDSPVDPLQGYADVLDHRQVREHRGDLIGAHDAPARDVLGRFARDVDAVEEDCTARRRQELRQQVEAGRLAGTVGSDKRVDRAAADLQVDVVDRDEAFEFLRQATRLEDDVSGCTHAEAASIAT